MHGDEKVKQLKKALREQRLEEESDFGRQHSSIFEDKPNSQKDRKRNKNKLNQVYGKFNFDDE